MWCLGAFPSHRETYKGFLSSFPLHSFKNNEQITNLQIVGNEMMHAYDVTGIAYDEMAELRPWASASFTREYTQRALCLRQSHGAAVSTGTQTLGYEEKAKLRF